MKSFVEFVKIDLYRKRKVESPSKIWTYVTIGELHTTAYKSGLPCRT